MELDANLSHTVNYESFLPLVRICKEAGVRRFIFASSGSVYGVSDSPDVTEEHPLVPVSLYNKYKAMCEKVLLPEQTADFVPVIVRPATICGHSPRQRLDLTVNILTNHAVNAGKITVFGGTQMRPNLHIRDMIDLYTLLLEAPEAQVAGQIFNAAYQNYSVADTATIVREVVCREMPEKTNIEIVTTPSDDKRSYHINSDKIRTRAGLRAPLHDRGCGPRPDRGLPRRQAARLDEQHRVLQHPQDEGDSTEVTGVRRFIAALRPLAVLQVKATVLHRALESKRPKAARKSGDKSPHSKLKTMSTERFLVIGSNSFSGASFVAGLLEAGAEVLGISRSPEADAVFLPYRWMPHDRFTFRQLDLNRDLDKLDAALHEFQPDYVVNFAAQGMVAQSWQNPEHWYQTNTIAMVRLHERLRKCKFLKKFVQASTPEVYGNTSGVIREDAPFNPSTPYAISKAACDMNLLAYHKAYGFPVGLHAVGQCLRTRAGPVSHHPQDDPLRPHRQETAAGRGRQQRPLVHPHPRRGRRHAPHLPQRHSGRNLSPLDRSARIDPGPGRRDLPPVGCPLRGLRRGDRGPPGARRGLPAR